MHCIACYARTPLVFSTLGSRYTNASDECPDNSDWGRLYLAAEPAVQLSAGRAEAMRAAFAAGERLPQPAAPPILAADLPAVAASFKLSVRGAATAPPVTQTLVLAYDTGVEVRWFGRDLPPLWTRYYSSAAAMAGAALAEQASARADAAAFGEREVAKYSRLGGPKFAAILSLAYRQAYGSTVLAWNEEAGTHWQFVQPLRPLRVSYQDDHVSS